MDLKAATVEELKAELAARGQPPKPLVNPDWTDLIELLRNTVAEVDESGCDPEADHYIAEAAFEALYGPNFYDWWNEKVE